MQPKPVGDLLFLQRLYDHAGQGTDRGAALSKGVRHVAPIVGLPVEHLDRNVDLGMHHEKVAPQPGKFRITLDKVLNDRLDDLGFAGGMIHPVGKLRWPALDLLDDSASKRVKRCDATLQGVLRDLQLGSDPCP
jgi:hypothetical protein